MNSASLASKFKKNKKMFQFHIPDLHGATNAMVDYIMEDVEKLLDSNGTYIIYGTIIMKIIIKTIIKYEF